jgi:hypothetical protein
MAVEKSTHLGSGRSVGRCVDGLDDTVGGVVASGCAEKEGGACGAVVPHREGSLKVRQPDAGATVENSVYGAEAQDLGFGPTGGGAAESRTDLAQDRIALVPESSCLLVAAEASIAFANKDEDKGVFNWYRFFNSACAARLILQKSRPSAGTRSRSRSRNQVHRSSRAGNRS